MIRQVQYRALRQAHGHAPADPRWQSATNMTPSTKSEPPVLTVATNDTAASATEASR